MCFFKTLPTPPAFPSSFDKDHFNPLEESTDLQPSNDLGTQPPQKKMVPLSSKQHWLLMNCLGLVDGNSNMMALMDQVCILLFRN